ncbi:hypothetical protein AGMMS49587_11410 [Spirochaetia bacterium]|nr:hypothetical protein AGMMS49587_11410 [Spirochaetia bacterium]
MLYKYQMKKTVIIFFVMVIGLMVSCASIGQFMPSLATDAVIGNVQVVFVTRDSWFTRNAINTQAYIKLLEEAGKKFPGNIDIRDIIWTTGRVVDWRNKEIAATGKVIQIK